MDNSTALTLFDILLRNILCDHFLLALFFQSSVSTTAIKGQHGCKRSQPEESRYKTNDGVQCFVASVSASIPYDIVKCEGFAVHNVVGVEIIPFGSGLPDKRHKETSTNLQQTREARKDNCRFHRRRFLATAPKALLHHKSHSADDKSAHKNPWGQPRQDRQNLSSDCESIPIMKANASAASATTILRFVFLGATHGSTLKGFVSVLVTGCDVSCFAQRFAYSIFWL